MIFQKPLKTSFKANLGPHLPPKAAKHSFYYNLSLYAVVTSCKKSEKFDALLFYNTWSSAKTWKCDFSEKMFRSILSLYANVTKCKKIRKILNFPEKFWMFWPKNIKIQPPPKKLCRSILWLYVALTSYKKSEKSHVSVWQET